MTLTPDNFTSADFGTIRADISSWMKARSGLRDVDFDGSTASILVDALAYAANYMAVHSNTALGEAFLDSAQQRNSVVSHAKGIGYVPAQISSARATVRLSCNATAGSIVWINEGSKFSSTFGQFVALNATQMTELVPGLFTATIDVHEGDIAVRNFFMNPAYLVPKFTITDKDVDAEYLRAFVTPPSSLVTYEYQKPLDFIRQTNTSEVFYWQEGVTESLEIYFGDNVISKRPSDNSAIQLKYLTTHGKLANGASNFALETFLSGSLGNVDPRDVDVETLSTASHGASKQSIDSIKITAPRYHASQNRGVTEDDYNALLESKYSFIQTSNVWGGEKNVPPLYGQVLVAIKPKDGLRLSPQTKLDIQKNLLDRFSVVGLTPRIVDPDYLFVDLDLSVDYRADTTRINEQELSNIIRAAISTYFDSTVTRFDSLCRTSAINDIVLGAYHTIAGVRPAITLRKELKVESGTADRRWDCDFRNPLVPGSLRSVPVNNAGGLPFRLVENLNRSVDAYINNSLVSQAIASVNNGKLSIPRYRFDLTVPEIFITAVPAKLDVVSVREGLIVLGQLKINLVRI